MKRFYLTFSAIILLTLSIQAGIVQAQTAEPTAQPTAQPTAEPTSEPGPGDSPIPQIHTVESGENLTFIAEIYGVSVAELQAINNLADDALLYVGQPLIIPGGSGDAIATIYETQVGDSLHSVAAAYNTPLDSLLQTNRLVNRNLALVAGQSLSVISRTGSALPQPVSGIPHIVAPGETSLMIAARYNMSPAALAAANDLPSPTFLYPGQRLRIPSQEIYRDLPGEWLDIQVRPWPVVQGGTVSIFVRNALDGTPAGALAGQSMRFTPHLDGYVALVGLDAFTEPDKIALTLSGSGSRPWQPFRQELRVESGGYGIQYITLPEELNDLLAPEIRQNEDAFLETIYTRFTDTQYWDGLFQVPVTNTIVTARYGDSRSYNNGPIEIFHTGVDFGGGIGTPILAPANGVVVFNDILRLRGNTLIVDHGLGVMTAYFHLSESFVNVGDMVSIGQPIAAGGSTGLSSGPHLHWDLRVMNVAVDGLQWSRETFP